MAKRKSTPRTKAPKKRASRKARSKAYWEAFTEHPTTAFEELTQKLAAHGAYNPKALAAWIGRRKLGKRKFQKLAAEGKRRASLMRRR